jgi:hypothetical protein
VEALAAAGVTAAAAVLLDTLEQDLSRVLSALREKQPPVA